MVTGLSEDPPPSIPQRPPETHCPATHYGGQKGLWTQYQNYTLNYSY